MHQVTKGVRGDGSSAALTRLHPGGDEPDDTHTRRLARLEAAEHERQRLGRELHDGLCQHLAGIAALSAALSRRLPQQDAATSAAQVAEIGQLLQQAVVCARDLAQGLCPPELRGGGLAQALALLAGNVSTLFGVACTFESPAPCPDLGADANAHVFRIVQEAVHNAVVHGRSSRIDIVLGAGAPGEGRVCVSDNGTGLPDLDADADADADPDSTRRGLGLRSMAHRAGLIGGSLVVQRQRPLGTLVSCTFRVPGPGLGAG